MVKRFIAGATCPKCGSQDSIRAEHNDQGGMLRRECVECGFADELSNLPRKELKTRVNQDNQPDVQAEPVRILDPDKLH